MADYSEHAALSPVITRSGKAGAWSIQREWICEDGMAQTLIDSLWGTTAEGFTGFNPPKCDYVRSRPEEIGRAHV